MKKLKITKDSNPESTEETKDSKKKEISFNFDDWKKKFICPYLKDISEYIQ